MFTPIVHTFDSSGNAYDGSQCFDHIHSGDVLYVPSEGSAAVLRDAWPIAVNKDYVTDVSGAFHTLKPGHTLDIIDGGIYSESARIARNLLRTITNIIVEKDTGGHPITEHTITVHYSDGEERFFAGTASACLRQLNGLYVHAPYCNQNTGVHPVGFDQDCSHCLAKLSLVRKVDVSS